MNKSTTTRKSTSLLFKRLFEYVPIAEKSSIPAGVRGIYALYQYQQEGNFMNLMYVGMTNNGARGRLNQHGRGRKKDEWTHFSVYEVWDNITQEQIKELEDLFLHTLKRDASANSLNIQKKSTVFEKLRKETKVSQHAEN